MRVLIHDYSRHPYTAQLARSLAKRGHDVLYLYSAASLPRNKLGKPAADRSKIEFRGIPYSKPYEKWSLVRRWFQEQEYGGRLAAEITAFEPSVVISATTPVLAQQKALRVCQEKRIGFVLWVQDLQGVAVESILRRRIPLLGALVGRYFVSLERSQFRRSNRIVLISEDFRRVAQDWVRDERDIYTIPNWMPLDEIPQQPKANDWAQQHGLDDKICFTYAGVLGFKHKPDLIVELALRFAADARVRIVIVSDGLGVGWLRERQAELHLTNLVIVEFQPFELIPKILGASDILFGVLEPEASDYSVPSKVAAYLCAGRPILYSMSKENLAARIITENGAGLVVPPGDVRAFMDAAVSLVRDPGIREALGRNARKYAETHFDIENIAAEFDNIIAGLAT